MIVPVSFERQSSKELARWITALAITLVSRNTNLRKEEEKQTERRLCILPYVAGNWVNAHLSNTAIIFTSNSAGAFPNSSRDSGTSIIQASKTLPRISLYHQ